MKFNCSYCGKESEKPTGHINRAKKNGSKIFCSIKCFGLSRRDGKSLEQKKKEKSDYDREYRKKNNDKIIKRRKEYYKNNKKEIYKKERAKRDNDEYREKHAEYCRLFCQRYKERIRRYVRVYGSDWRERTKFCISCNTEKHFMKFSAFSVFPDGRRHICNDCEEKQKKENGYTTRGTMTAMVSRRYTSLKREDIAKYPYLIEANKYLILLKQLLDEKRKTVERRIS